MDKYKTATLGKALKSVFRGEMQISDSVELAKKEISDVFKPHEYSLEKDLDDGFVGDEIGICPLCGEKIVRTVFGYGCTGYKDKNCKFSVNNVIYLTNYGK